MNVPEPLPLEIDVQTVKSMCDAKQEFVLLDCRERDEFALAHIEGAQLQPMSEIQQRLANLQEMREVHLVVHCHHGGRSLQVTQWLRQQGFERVQNMTGGIDAWSRQIDVGVPRY